MSISDDNTNELDSYGVWVKNTSENDTAAGDDVSLDLPDFDDTDFSDMFKDDSQFANNETADAGNFADDIDSTLSTDELANITDMGDVSIENVEAPVNDENDLSLDLDTEFGETDSSSETELTADTFEEPAAESSEEIGFDEPVTEASEEISFDEPTAEASEEVTFEEPADDSVDAVEDSTEEVSFDGDEEISLDDFMDGGFSDESVASGNNGFEPGAEPKADISVETSGETEELSLDDFMDGDSFDAPAEEAKEEVTDEPPLEMDISFDSSAESVETETNVSLEDNYDIDDSEEDTEEPVVEQTVEEEVSLDDFGAVPEVKVQEEHIPDTSNISTEEIDLSDFGIDANAEETPITQDVEEAKNKDVVVDYDLSVGDENTSAAPIVNEIKDTEKDDISDIEDLTEDAPEISENTTSVDNTLLQQIVTDLSGLKDEINKLKVNLEEMKSSEHIVQSAPVEADVSVESVNNDVIIEDTVDEGGFFSSDDGDDTIALSFDELDNIMNNAEFSDAVNVTSDEETVIENEPAATEETFVEMPSEDAAIEEEAAAEEDSFDSVENSLDSNIELEDSPSEEIEFNYENEKLEEPVIDDITLDGEDEIFEGDELPSEISIPKEEDMVIESNSTDFMDSVKDSTEDEMNIDSFDESAALDDIPSELPEEVETISEDITEESAVEEPVVEEIVTEDNDNLSIEDTVIEESEEPTIEESAIDESITDDQSNDAFSGVDDFAEVDNLDNNLSSSNMDYLNKPEETSETAPVTSDLKQDIKSVLLYMDQLLENLPEEKIVEFAKSEEFTTYKKLFSELGLS